jgi:hypothetical protein
MTDKTDPAEKVKEEQEKERLLDDMKTIDINNLTLGDFEAIPKRQARMTHPFEGYPLKEKVVIGKKPNGHKIKESATFVVGLSPHAHPSDDVSGLGVTIIDTKTKKERTVNLGTFHSRVIPTGPHHNEDVVFDRVMDLADGNKIFFALVKNHNTRAQIFFYYDSKNKRIEVDNRYLLLDKGQNSRLQTLYSQIINPKLRRERMAQQVAGEIESTEESLKEIPTG